MKKEIFVMMAGAALLIFAGSQSTVQAMNFEEDMAEGITLSVIPEDNADYVYDSTMPNPEEFMSESHVLNISDSNIVHYKGDSSTPSMQNMMADGICLETFNKGTLAAK